MISTSLVLVYALAARNHEEAFAEVILDQLLFDRGQLKLPQVDPVNQYSIDGHFNCVRRFYLWVHYLIGFIYPRHGTRGVGDVDWR